LHRDARRHAAHAAPVAVTGPPRLAHFPAAPLGGVLAVLLVWAAVGAVLALTLGGRARPQGPRAEAALAAAAAP
jgi:hypothetical protein